MILNISNKNRFVHVRELQKYGGKITDEAEDYYEKNKVEVDKEYDEIMKVISDRDELGGNNKIHNYESR